MKSRNLINSFSERIKDKAGGWNHKTVQRVTYTAVFAVVCALVATSYVGADSNTQVSLPGASSSDSINVNVLQGQKIDQIAQADAVASSVSQNAGGQLANGATGANAGDGSGSGSANSGAAQATTADDVKSANVASAVASVANLSSSNSVSSSAESANISAEMAQANATSVSKAQIVEPTSESKTLTTYTVKDGDNVDTVAAAHGVTSQTIRWANRLKDNNLVPGTNITIPAVDGVVYTVKDGDNLASLAGKYKSSVDQIITINNLAADTTVVPTGTVILLPDGTLPETERPEYVAPAPVRPTTRLSSGTGRLSAGKRGIATTMRVPAAGGNTYAYGYCTWYAYNRRVQLGLPVANRWGNANTWDTSAQSAGYLVNGTPSVGAIFQTDAGPYGHVGIVEAVYADGSIDISEMNYSGWGVLTIGNMSPADYSGYDFIH